jgi:hypothetical protein
MPSYSRVALTKNVRLLPSIVLNASGIQRKCRLDSCSAEGELKNLSFVPMSGQCTETHSSASQPLTLTIGITQPKLRG